MSNITITPEFLAYIGVDLQDYVLADYTPLANRASHEAAGNSGSWPHNGDSRGLVHVEELDEWTTEVREARPQDVVDYGWVAFDGVGLDHLSTEQAELVQFLELCEEADDFDDVSIGEDLNQESETYGHPEILVPTPDGDLVTIWMGIGHHGSVEVLGSDESGQGWPWGTKSIQDYLDERADTDNWS